jgi:hypothetical protein
MPSLGAWHKYLTRGGVMSRRTGQVLRTLGLGFGSLFSGAALVFIVGEATSDPGGVAGVAVGALVVLPTAALVVLAWYRPPAAIRVIGSLVAVVVVAAIWFAADAGGWRGFENAHGPVRAVSIVVLAPALALLGWRRPQTAGLMLVTLGLAPLLVASAASRVGSPSLVAVSLPVLIDGVIFLLATEAPGTHPLRPGASVRSRGA